MDDSQQMHRPLVSIVVPVFNEESNILPFYDAVSVEIENLQRAYRFEFVFTDNHSTDNTFPVLTALAAREPRLRAFRFSRNFGFQRSIMTGYTKARGDAAIQLDVDLQDPPALIASFLREWQSGADVVYGIRVKRKEGWWINLQRKVFYRLIDSLSEHTIPIDAGDFRLISRRVIDVLASLDDSQPYLRGTIATLGFKQVGIPYARGARVLGESKFPFSKLLALALDGILSHSTVPLRVATYIGLLISLGTFLLLVLYFVSKLAYGFNWPPGFATIVVLILLGIGVQAMLLGIIGEYLGRIYRQLRKEPLSIIEASVDGGLMASSVPPAAP